MPRSSTPSAAGASAADFKATRRYIGESNVLETTPNRLLQPPGFPALNYGRQTPLVTMIAHVLYGVIIGWFYQLS